MAYKHGIYGQEIATSLVPMTETDAGLIVAFGTAPAHLATAPVAANTPVLCYTYAEAVAAMGYSDDFAKYTLCEVMKAHFSLFNMAPIVLINVLDITKHKKSVEKHEVAVKEKAAVIVAPVLMESMKVFADGSIETPLTKDTDYTAAHDDDGNVLITVLDGGSAKEATSLYVQYDEADSTQVQASDIVGGVDINTGKAEGLELIDEIYPRFGLVPGIIIAPGFSDDTTVGAVMKAKTTNICGHFRAIAVADIPTETVITYTKASEWKNKNNYIDTSLIACWPKLKLGDAVYHMSTQLASLINKVDSQNGDMPYHSPSNASFQTDGAVLDDGTEIWLNSQNAAYLNGQGIVTALNFIGGWKAWGNRTTAYPSNTDVKDAFIPIRRMFNWVLNTLITSYWSKVDEPTNKRLINTMVDSANIWLNSLTAAGALLGGRVEFRQDENSTTDLMDGKIKFHVYLTPPSPAREITFVQEYDPDYIATLFA